MAKVRIEIPSVALLLTLRARVDEDMTAPRYTELPPEDQEAIREARIGKLEVLCARAWGSQPTIEIDDASPGGSATIRDGAIPF